jgi:GDP-mannose pyrophosphatase NudK
MENIKIIDRKVLTDETYRLEEIIFTKPGLDGKVHEQKNEIYFRPDAVAVLLIDKQKEEFILARQIRLPVFLNPQKFSDGYLIEACAGLIEEGEDPKEAVIREAKEETGFEIHDPKKVGEIYTSAGGLTEYLHLYLAEINSDEQQEDGGGAEGEGEDIELIRLSFSDAEQRIGSGQVDDAKTLLLLQHYFLFYNRL